MARRKDEGRDFLNRLRLSKVKSSLKKINRLKDQMSSLSNAELQAKTAEFKARLADGEHLDDLMVEAFAVVREADKRVLGMFPYDVQVMGAIVMHSGHVAEMKTGEGKTLTATMPMYLNALTGEGAIMVTVNEYLSRRDLDEIGPVYEFLGLTTASGVPERPEGEELEAEDKREIYAADIVYTTNGSLGFDYLIDHLADDQDKTYMRPLNYVLIDEIDEVLLDDAISPLVISGSPRVQSNLYHICDQFVRMLDESDYEMTEEEDAVWLKDSGIDKAERFLGVDNLYALELSEYARHIQLALQAHFLYQLNQDYVVQDGKVKLLDQRNGRVLEGTQLQSGSHQAIEAKEKVELSKDNRSMANITYQNLFKLFKKMSGMTGTGKTAESEFNDIYDMITVQIPPNKPNIRIDYPDIYYRTFPEKVAASLEYILDRHRTGQPVLISTGSVEISSLYSSLLLDKGVPHNVLNAYNAAKEAAIIKEAGQWGAVTVATSMAGRGTDIKLGEGVHDLGGLCIVGTERLMSERSDLQMRGRSGRQGDPGMTQFFACLEDDLIIKYGPEKYHFSTEDHPNYEASFEPLSQKKYQKVFDQAQKNADSQGKMSRQQAVLFDDNLRYQREIIYRERDYLLRGDHIDEINSLEIGREVVDHFLQQWEDLDEQKIERFIYDNLSYNYKPGQLDLKRMNRKDLSAHMLTIIQENIEEKKGLLTDEWYEDFKRKCILKAIDKNWVEQVDYLSQFKTVVSSRASAQKNPVYEYQEEAVRSYDRMKAEIKQDFIQNISLSTVEYSSGQPILYFP